MTTQARLFAGPTLVIARPPPQAITERPATIGGKTVWLHPECERFYTKAARYRDPWADYPELPESLRRSPLAEPPRAHGRAPAVGPSGDSVDDFR